MRILFITTTLGTRGGIQRVTTVKANYFADMPGNEVAIAFSDRLGWPENSIHPLSEKVKVFDMESPFWDRVPKRFDILWRFPQKALKLRSKIKHMISEFNPDVIISTGQFEKFIIPFVHFFGRKYIIVREYHFSSNYRQIEYRVRNGRDSLKPRLINYFENSIVAPLYDGNYLLTQQDKVENHKNNKHFSYIWNPTSFVVENEEILKEKKHIVLAAGRLTPQKNFSDLIKIWGKTARRDWILRILGTGEEQEKLIELVRELNLADSVQLVGYSNEVETEMKGASIFAATSLFEGFMLVLAEAMSQGCVPISYNTSYGPEDIITDRSDGFLIPLSNLELYAEKLSFLIESEERRESMALKALTRAQDFDISVICNRWMEEYQCLIKRKQGNDKN